MHRKQGAEIPVLPAAPGAVQSRSQSFPNAQGRLQDPGPEQDGSIRMWGSLWGGEQRVPEEEKSQPWVGSCCVPLSQELGCLTLRVPLAPEAAELNL